MLRIAKLVKQKRPLTQKQVAEWAGVHQSRLSLIVRGLVEAKPNEARALAEAFDCNWPELLEVLHE